MWLLVGVAAMALAPIAARADVCNQDIALCGPGETPAGCPSDCGDCGDLRCDPHESAVACPEDCGPCGNLRCEPGETLSCPDDCNITTCGDLVCAAGETGCPVDCGDAPCANGVDDDGDRFIDFPADDGCNSAADFSERFDCEDGIDNDGDGLVDYPADPSCLVAFGKLENPQCSNGIDDDADTQIDYPADAKCRSATDNDERTDPGCGLGAEIAVLIGALRWHARRRGTALRRG